MTSNPNADSTGSRDSTSPLERRTTSSSFSSLTNRVSSVSTENGESSTAASKRNSLITPGLNDGVADGAAWHKSSLDVERPVKSGRGSHRSHKSRNSGSFLLSNAAFEPPVENAMSLAIATETQPRQRHSAHESKGKGPLRSPEKKHAKRRSNVGASVGFSPLAANSTGAGAAPAGQNGVGRESVPENVNGGADISTRTTAAGLDVDSAQIVNLALNLSESRRIASRRVISNPHPHLPGGIGESTVGGSLRQHLQQQRRASRNISPKPDRGERVSRIPSGQKINSPLQAAFDTHPDGPYQYHFSTSTLARAEKAKNAIELMAQYRRLLQFVPPLKPQTLERPGTGSQAATDPGSPSSSGFAPSRSVSASAASVRHFGRPYNPLQYIRNRKVRARNSRAIDGEAQGFGDLDKVSSWVDEIAKEANSEDYQAADCLVLPAFSKAVEDAASPHMSPRSSAGKTPATTAKIRRPRIDWVTTPADMIADIFWLEQDDNKKLIEDHEGRLIFPQGTELRRPMSRRSEEPEPRKSPGPVIKKEEPDLNLRVDTKLPEFKSIKPDSEKAYDSPASRARQKLRDVRDATRKHHRYNGSLSDHRHLRSHSRSDSDSSDSDIGRQRRKRSGTADSRDRGKDILEKQMMEMLAKEVKQTEWSPQHDAEGQKVVDSNESRKSSYNEMLDKSKNRSVSHSRSASLVQQDNRSKRESVKAGSSGRASLDVPGGNPRGSLEFDSTAPNSPQAKASKIANAFVPSIAMDLSPPRSRNTSPNRRPLSRVRSKILPFYERGRDSSRVRAEEEIPDVLVGTIEPTPESPETTEGRRRSRSPLKKVDSRRADDGVRTAGSVRRGKGEESGIRGLFKGSKNPVTRMSDFLWKKEPSGISSGFSTDESETEDLRPSQTKSEKKGSWESSAGMPLDDFEVISSRKERPSFIPDMPVFTSPFDRRGRSARPKDDSGSPEPTLSQEQQAREERRRYSRAHLLDLPPRIDVQNASPTSSPDAGPVDRFQRDSSVSDIESMRGSFSNGVQSADARLNAILGLPGKRRNALPITGLSNLETSYGTRPSLEGKRQWSISDRGPSVNRGPMTKREIARVRALLLSSGIKAKEISRRAAELKDLRTDEDSRYKDVAFLTREEIKLVPKSQEHRLAARIISDDIQLSSQMWHTSADTFCNITVSELLDRIESLRSRVSDSLTPLARKAADEADEVSKDLVTSQTLQVKSIGDKISKMMRRRSRKFRWLRRGGWVMVEWALVGVMWCLWFMVVLVRIVMGIGRGAVTGVRWLFWL